MSIITTDTLNNLKVLHYDQCDINSSSDLKQHRGVIYSSSTSSTSVTSVDKIMCKSFPFTPEINVNDSELLNTHVVPNLEGALFFESHEGTIVRLWYHNDEHKWYISTHRKIDAFTSKWGINTSYGEIFNNVMRNNISLSWADQEDEMLENENTNYEPIITRKIFDRFCETCNKNYVYTFLIRNTDANRIVIRDYKEPHMFCIGMFDRTNNFAFIKPNNTLKFSSPIEYTFTTLSQCITDIQNIDPYKLQGLIMIQKNGQCIKLLNSEYDRLQKLRANVPSLEFRYLQVRCTELKDDFIQLYIEHSTTFDNVEKILNNIIHNIFKKYIYRFVQKKQALLPPCQYNLMTKIHNLYLTRKVEKVDLSVVLKAVNECTDKELYSLLQNYKQNERKYGNGNFISENLKQKILKE
jgi:hypothetical protein